MPKRPGFFRRIVNRIREVIAPPITRRRRRPPPPPPRPTTPTGPTPRPTRPTTTGAPRRQGRATIDDRGFDTTESEHMCRTGDFEGNLATWTVAGWVTTNQDKRNSWTESEDRDNDEPTDTDLGDTDYALVDIRVAGGQYVLPFVGPFPNGRDELDNHVINWLEQGSPPGEWGAG